MTEPSDTPPAARSVLERLGHGLFGLVAVLSALVAVSATALVVADYRPAPVPGSLDFGLLKAILVLDLFAVGGLCMALQLSDAKLFLWLARAGIAVALLFAAFFYRSATLVELLESGGFVAALLVVHHLAHRHVLGWIIDAQGERQKVDHWNRGSAVYKPTTRSQRIVQEATLKAKRRKTMALASLLGGVPALCAWWMLGTDNSTLAFVPAAIGAPFLLVAAWELLIEAIYQTAWQDLPGAKVLDAAPVKPGLDAVGGQKVYGRADIATAEEAIAALNQPM